MVEYGSLPSWQEQCSCGASILIQSMMTLSPLIEQWRATHFHEMQPEDAPRPMGFITAVSNALLTGEDDNDVNRR